MGRITNLENPPSQPVWSPDGRSIAFKSFVSRPPKDFAQLPPPPSGASWADPAVVVDRYMYRYDGIGYLEPGYIHLFVVSADGGTPRQVSTGDFHHGRPWAHASEAVWTPDGKFLLMSTNRHSNYEFDQMNSEIYEFDLEKKKVRALTSRQGPDEGPSVSPDGKYIAYVGFDDKFMSFQAKRLYVMKRDGSGTRMLSGDLDRSVSSARWAPDGSGVFCLYTDHGNTKIALYDLEGHRKIVAANVGTGGRAYHYGLAYTVANTGAVAFTYTRPDIPGDVAVLGPGGSDPRVITAVNRDLLSQRTLGEVEEVWYESSLDQQKIHGWILKPPGFDPKRKYPLILEIHGGPLAAYGDRFATTHQIMASNGYVVLYTNPRGSTSYGSDFANQIHHAYPGNDFFDLDSGVDMMIEKDYIDGENLFVTGGSGGGILTCWMIGRTDRFRAAASLYPAINWYAFVLTIDDPLFLRYQFPGFPWDHVEHFEKRNLLSVVKNVKTPTMLITGDKDYRTPLWEAEQYYRALKLLDVETVLVRVPGEPHGTRNRPSHFAAKIRSILGWFNEHKVNEKR